MPSASGVRDDRITFESAAQHVTTEIPVAPPTRQAGELRQEIMGRRYESASHIIVCEGESFAGILRVEDLLAAPSDRTLAELMDRDAPVVAPGVDQEVAAWRAVRNGESALAVVDARGVVLDRCSAAEFDGLSKQQQVYYAVWIYDVDVGDGGHAQFFVNSGGDRWRSTLNALKTVGAIERAAILKEACDLFGPDGPPEDNEARHHQLAHFTRRQDKQLETLDERYFQCQENINVLLMQYAIEHREHFVRDTA